MEEAQLYFFDPADNAARGPFSLEQLIELAQTAQIQPNTLVAPPDHDRWIPINEWPELRMLLFPAPDGALHLGQQHQAAPEADASMATDIYEVLAINRALEDPDKVIISEAAMHPKMSRRTKDYLWGFFGVNGFLLGAAGLYTLLYGVNVVVIIYTISFITIWSLGFTWVTFALMSRW